MSLLSQDSGGLTEVRKQAATCNRPEVPNLWAHLTLLCAVIPLAIIVLLVIVEETNPELLGPLQRVGGMLVPVVTLGGAVFGLLGARCFWRDTRRGGMAMIIVGLFGCGMWVLWYRSILDWVMGLF